MKSIKKYLYIITVALLTSCYSSDENYEYGSDVQLSINGVESLYSLVTGYDVLNIDPEVVVTNEGDELSYVWEKFDFHEGSFYSPDNMERDTISREKVLNYPITGKALDYTIALTVRNHTTGQIASAVAKLNIRNKFSTGFFVLKEINGDSDIDMFYDETTSYKDILFEDKGERVDGAPISIGIVPTFNYISPIDNSLATTRAISVVTDKGFKIIDTDDLSYRLDETNMFGAGNTGDVEPLYINTQKRSEAM